MASTTAPAHIDLSAVDALTDAELKAQLEVARVAMMNSRHNPTGLAHTDAKLAHRVLGAEVRRRIAAAPLQVADAFRVQAAAHVAVRDAAHAPGHACGAECWYAASAVATCVCSCGGAQHGARRREVAPATSARDPFARLAQDDDEPF